MQDEPKQPNSGDAGGGDDPFVCAADIGLQAEPEDNADAAHFLVGVEKLIMEDDGVELRDFLNGAGHRISGY